MSKTTRVLINYVVAGLLFLMTFFPEHQAFNTIIGLAVGVLIINGMAWSDEQ